MTDAFKGYRRRIRITPMQAPAGLTRIRVAMEDDFHGFSVTLAHNGATITEVRVDSFNAPWTTCPAAGDFLRERFTGLNLAEATGEEDQRQHCTHMFDLAMHGISHSGLTAETTYDITIEDPSGDQPRRVQIMRDDEVLLSWRLGAGPDADGDMAAMNAWTRTLPEHLREAGTMLRRGVMVGQGRQYDLAAKVYAAEVGAGPVCYTQQPHRNQGAKRIPGTIRDFSARPDDLLANLDKPSDA